MDGRLPDGSEEFYGMPAFPTLAVADPTASTRWYDAIGFRHVFTLPGPGDRPALVHLRWAKYADLLLRPGPREGRAPVGTGVTLTFAMFAREGETVDDVAARARNAGAATEAEPSDRPWNSRETTLLDPDGYRLTFTQPGDTSGAVTMDDVVARVKRSGADAHPEATKEHAPG